MAAAGHILACRCSQTPPQSYAFSLDSLLFSPVFWRGESRVGHFLDLLTKVNVTTSAGAERFARANNLLVSSRYLEFYRFVQHEVEWFCGGCTHVLTFLHSYVKDFEKEAKSGVNGTQRNSIYNINIIYTISLAPYRIHFS